MTLEQILQMIEDGENFHVEFKSDHKGQLSMREICEAVICLANSEGGIIIVGVENNGRITGVQPRTGEQLTPELLRAVIFNNTEPPIDTEVQSYTIMGNKILSVQVERYSGICSTKDGKILRRAMGIRGPECAPFYPYQLFGRLGDLRGLDYTNQLIYNASWDDLDLNAFIALRKYIKENKGDTQLLSLDDYELAKALQLVETHQGILKPNVAGILILGQASAIKKFIPTHAVAIQFFNSDGAENANAFFTNSLLLVLSECEQIISQNIHRLKASFYSPRLLQVLNEAIKNALVHRDYSRRGFIYIQYWPDQVLITNPGPFLDSINLNNLITHEPVYRNSCLAVSLYRIGLTRNTGSGIDQLYREQILHGHPIPDYTLSDRDYTRLLLRCETDFQILAIIDEQRNAGNLLPLQKLLILYFLRKNQSITCQQAAKVIQLNEETAFKHLQDMVTFEILQKVSFNDQIIFKLSPAHQHLADKSPASGEFTPTYRKVYEAVINQYLEVHPKITLHDASSLLNIPEEETKIIVKAMLENGILAMKGKNAFELLHRQS